MRKKSPTLVCRLSMSLTTKAPEHGVLGYDLPRGPAVDRGKVAQAAQKTAQAEAPHAAQAAQAAAIRTAIRLRAISEARGRGRLGPLSPAICRSKYGTPLSYFRHSVGPIAARQYASTIAKHNQTLGAV